MIYLIIHDSSEGEVVIIYQDEYIAAQLTKFLICPDKCSNIYVSHQICICYLWFINFFCPIIYSVS